MQQKIILTLLVLSLIHVPSSQVLTPLLYIEQTTEVNRTIDGSKLPLDVPVPSNITNSPNPEGIPSQSHDHGTASYDPVYRQHSFDEPLDLGTFTVTAYCACSICCGEWSQYKLTASGTTPTSKRTVAVDTDVIPFDSILIIDGVEYIAEDTGSAVKGNHIDIFFDSHEDALEYGVQEHQVFIKQQ